MRQPLKKFGNAKQGSFAPIMAIGSIPLLLAVGLSVDYAAGVQTHSNMQNALDAATLSLTKFGKSVSDVDRQQYLQAAYAANGGKGAAVLGAVSFAADGTLSISTTARYAMPTNFMAIANVQNVPINVSSAILKPPTLVKATFNITKVSGWWNKTLTLYGTRINSPKAEKLMEATYVYNNFGSGKGYGTTTVKTPDKNGSLTNVVQQQKCTTQDYGSSPVPAGAIVEGKLGTICKFTVGAGTGAAIDVSQMQDLYLQMDVPNGQPSILKSNDPKTSDRLFLDVTYDRNGYATGTEVANGQIVDIFSVVPCGDTSNQAWEDGGSKTPGLANDADFFYSVTGKCDYSQRVSMTRLTH